MGQPAESRASHGWLFLSLLAWGLGYGLVVYLIPVYVRELGATPVQLGLVFAISLLTATVSLIPGGYLSELYDLRTVIIWSGIVAVPFGIPFALARTWWHVIPGELLLGISFFGVPAIRTYVAIGAHPERISSVFTRIFAGFPIGMVVSPAVGGYLAEVIGIRAVFLVSTVLILVSTLFLFGLAPAKTTFVGWRESFDAIVKNRSFRRYLFLIAAAFFLIQLFYPFVPAYVREEKGLSIAAIGLLGSVTALGAAVLGPAFGWVSDARGRRIGIAGCLVFSAVGLAGLVLAGRLVALVPFFLLLGCADALRAVAAGAIGKTMIERPSALAFAIYDGLLGIAMFVAPYLGGLLYGVSPRVPFVVAVVALPVLGAAVLVTSVQGRAP